MKDKIDEEQIREELGSLANGQVMIADPRTEHGLAPLLRFDPADCRTHPRKCAQISAILMTAADAELMPEWDNLRVLRDYLLQTPPDRTTLVLDAMKARPDSIRAIAGKFMLEARMGGPFTGIDVDHKKAELLEVSPDTMLNLECAQVVNAVVKSIITDGAPNQAPDLFRTSGRNALLYANQSALVDALLDSSGIHAKTLAAQYDAQFKPALELDKMRLENGAAPGTKSLYEGESCYNIFTNGYKAAVTGTAKCGEHAATSLTLLADAQSLAKLGVNISDGSVVIYALGNEIDHAYVLIAAPGTVSFSNDRERKVQVNDPRNVVVVDPWMPVPCAHTLDRSTADIQQNPLCKLAMVKNQDAMWVLDRNELKTMLQPAPQAMLDVFRNVQRDHREKVLNMAQQKFFISRNDETNMVLGCAQMLKNSIIPLSSRPPFYRSSHMSTHTPHDTYHCGGEPRSFFAADPRRHSITLESIDHSSRVDPVDIALTADLQKLRRNDKVVEKTYGELANLYANPAFNQLAATKRTQQPALPPNIIEEEPPAQPQKKKSLRDDPAMRSTMQNVELRNLMRTQSPDMPSSLLRPRK